MLSVENIESDGPPLVSIDTQFIYRGSEGLPTVRGQTPIRTQVFYRTKQPFKFPARVFWKSKNTQSHNKGQWVAGPGYLKDDLLKWKIGPPPNTDINCPNVKENLFRNELLNASKLVGKAVAPDFPCYSLWEGKEMTGDLWKGVTGGGGSMYRPCRIKTSSGEGKGMREEDWYKDKPE